MAVEGAGVPDSTRRALRTILQLVASGGLTALVNAIAGGLSPATSVLVLALFQVIVTYAQNFLEDNTSFPTILKGPTEKQQEDPPDLAVVQQHFGLSEGSIEKEPLKVTIVGPVALQSPESVSPPTVAPQKTRKVARKKPPTRGTRNPQKRTPKT